MTAKERRETLADFLENVVQPALDGARFDMRVWGTSTGDRRIPPRSLDIERLSECGFAGCAAGWGKFCPELREEGMPVDILYGTLSTNYWDLAEFFFEDNFRATEWVFNPCEYDEPTDEITIPMVVERLRNPKGVGR